MADKYIIEGATYNGNGTTSSEAASAGAAGAWNHINIITGTAVGYGALNAGDAVHIRSKTSAGADVTLALGAAANLGSASATTGSWIRWIVDAGTVWAGVSGVVSITAAGNYPVTFLSYNDFIADAADALRVVNTATTTPSAWTLALFQSCAATNLLLDGSAATGGYAWQIQPSSGANHVLTNLHVKLASRYDGVFVGSQNSIETTLVNPHIELTVAQSAYPVFSYTGYGSRVIAYGGKITGAGATTGQNLTKSSNFNGQYDFVGLQYPKTMGLGDGNGGARVNLFGADGGIGGGMLGNWGEADSRDDGNYPYLNATLPDSAATGWSWKVYPKAASRTKSIIFPVAAKLFTDTPATKTITLDLQIADSYTGLDTSTLWMSGYYIDGTTGAPIHFTTRTNTGSALTASTAAWSSTTWGAISCVKRKLEYTTPTTIKQNTAVVVLLCGVTASPSANDVIFACPDVQLS
jgi:hypothetical protein